MMSEIQDSVIDIQGTLPLDREGNTPLHLACEDNQDSVAILLVQRGANPKRENKEEKTPLDLTQNAELRRKLINAAGQH